MVADVSFLNLRTFQPKADEGVFLGYSTNSKAYRVYNKRTKKIEESVHVVFYEGNKKTPPIDELSERFKELLLRDSKEESSERRNITMESEDDSDVEKLEKPSNNKAAILRL